MSYWPELVDAAVLGSGRAAPPAPKAGVLDGAAGPAPELLDLAALTSRARRAGYVAAAAADRQAPEPAPLDDRPLVTAAAARRLAELIETGELDLVIEWMRLLAASGRQPPAALLPELLTIATKSARARTAITPALGPLAAWLARANPAWHWVSAHTAPPDVSTWTTETHAVRREMLARLRRADPEQARELVLSTWSGDSARDRAAFLAALTDGLRPDDEPLLNRALADRSTEVRRTAADLLARLPGSAFSRRAAARAAETVRVIPGPDWPHLVVTPPADATEEMRADGIDPSPPKGAGRQAWLLRQVVAAAPAASWPAEPAALLARAASHEWATPLMTGWTDAAVRDRDRLWVEALLVLAAPGLARSDFTARNTRLLAALSEADLASWLAANPDSPVFNAVELVPAPWPPDLSATVRGKIVSLADADQESDRPLGVSKLLRLAATRLEPPSLPELPELPDPPGLYASPVVASAWAYLMTTLSVRAAMRRELAEESRP
jgi:hypothetical protein